MPRPSPQPRRLTRRRFLQGAAATAAAGYAASTGLGGLIQGARDEEWPAIIIGSGYGGGVSALRLAQRGVRTLMLEMGRYWNPATQPFRPMTNPGKSSVWRRNWNIMPIGVNLPVPFSAGVLGREDFPGMQVYVGHGVGGGSLVNGGMAVVPRRDHLQQILPGAVDLDDLYGRWFPLAQAELGVHEIDPSFFATTPWYQFARLGIDQARKAGFGTAMVPNVYDFDYMRQEAAGSVPASALDGEVILGNNHGKKSIDKTYLARALATGRLTIRTRHQVQRISQGRDGTYVLQVNLLDGIGDPIGSARFRTKRLFINAGSLGTTRLLLRARETGTLPDLPAAIGETWGNNGNIMTARAWVGRTGAKQSTIPVAGIDNWSDRDHPFFAEIAPLPAGVDLMTGLYLAIVNNPARARIAWNAAKDDIAIQWKDSYDDFPVRTAEYMVNRLNDANGGTFNRLLFPSGTGHDFTYHPLGGCLLGQATDDAGRVQGYPGLYVMDGALINGNVGVNPFLTITALAERNMARVIAEDFR